MRGSGSEPARREVPPASCVADSVARDAGDCQRAVDQPVIAWPQARPDNRPGLCALCLVAAVFLLPLFWMISSSLKPEWQVLATPAGLAAEPAALGELSRGADLPAVRALRGQHVDHQRWAPSSGICCRAPSWPTALPGCAHPARTSSSSCCFPR